MIQVIEKEGKEEREAPARSGADVAKITTFVIVALVLAFGAAIVLASPLMIAFGAS